MKSPDHRISFLRQPGLRAWLDASSPHASLLQAQLPLITSIPSSFTPIPTKNRMNKVWEGALEGIPGTFILKIGWCNPVYSRDRRIVRRINMALHNRFLQSMRLSPRLDAISFPAVRAVLCWKRIPHLLPTEIGVLYPKVEAPFSLRRYLDDPANPRAFRNLPLETTQALGRLVRRLNQAGLVHVDPAPQNILLRSDAANPPLEDDFVFIDVDAFRALHASPASPLGRWHRTLAMNRIIRLFPPTHLAAFCEGFAFPSESPDAWIRIFSHSAHLPNHKLLSRLSLLLRSLPPFHP